MKLAEVLRSDDVGRNERICSDEQAFCALLESVNTYKLPLAWAGDFRGANSRALAMPIAVKNALKDSYAQS